MGPDIFKFITPYTAHPDPNGGVANAISGLGHWGDLQREDTREKDTVAHNAQVEQRLNQDLWLKGNNQFWGQRKDKAGIVAQYDALIAQGTDEGDAAAAAMAPEMKAYGIDLKPLDPTDATPGQPIQDWHAQVTKDAEIRAAHGGGIAPIQPGSPGSPTPEDVVTPPGSPQKAAKPPKKGTIEADIAALPDELPGDETPGAQPEPKGPIGGYKAPSRLLQKGMLQSQDQGALPSQAERQASEDAIASIGGKAEPVAPDEPVRTVPPLMKGGLPVPIPRPKGEVVPAESEFDKWGGLAARMGIADPTRREGGIPGGLMTRGEFSPEQLGATDGGMAKLSQTTGKGEAPSQAPKQGKEAPAAPAQSAPRQRPRYRVMIDGEDMGVVDPNPAHKAQEEGAARAGSEATAGIVSRYQSLMKGFTAGAKSVPEVEARIKNGMAEIDRLLSNEAMMAVAASKAKGSGSTSEVPQFKTGDEMAGEPLKEKSVSDAYQAYPKLQNATQLIMGNSTSQAVGYRELAKAINSGALSDKDAVAPDMFQSWSHKLLNFLSTGTMGTLTPEEKADLRETLARKQTQAHDQLQAAYENTLDSADPATMPSSLSFRKGFAHRMEKIWGKFDFFDKKRVLGIVGLGYGEEPKGAGGGGESVTVRGANPQTGKLDIPKKPSFMQ